MLAASAAASFAHATPAQWHVARRKAILAAHPEVQNLIGREQWTLPALAATNALQLSGAVACAHLPDPALVPLAVLVGGTLSLWQFALLHDVKHGTAALPDGVDPNAVLFAGSLPSLFGYFLYLRHGHLTHHKDFGRQPLKQLFNSEVAAFEDGDALFVAHRQQMRGDAPHARVGFVGQDDVGGLGLSISRTIYSLLWLDDADADAHSAARARAAYNAAVFGLSMSFERAALVFGGAVVPAHGPQLLLRTSRLLPRRARTTRARRPRSRSRRCRCRPGRAHVALLGRSGLAAAHPGECDVRVQPPVAREPGGRRGAATASVYLSSGDGYWYAWLCCFSTTTPSTTTSPTCPPFD